MNGIIFASPKWLWMIGIIPFLYLLVIWQQKIRMQQFENFAHKSVWSKIAPELDFSSVPKKMRIWLLAMIFVVLALARPQWGSHEESVHVTGLDLMITLDVSNSMEVEDVVPSRLKKAKHLVRTLSNRLQGDRVGIVAFAGGAFMACPLTTDTDYMLEALDILHPRSVMNQGTDIGIGLQTAMRALDRGAEQANPQDEDAPPSRVILLISDGEDHEEAAIAEAKKLREAGVQLLVLGVGTEKGGQIPIRDENGQNFGFKRDRKGSAVVSTFNSKFLSELADAAGGKYWTISNSESEVEDILSTMGALNRAQFAERRYMVREERYQIPLAIAVILLLLEMTLPAKILRVRKGSVALLIAGLNLGSLGVSDAQAAPLESYLENEKGLKAFQKGKTEEARKHFGSAQALDPALPEFQFNQGVVQMQQGQKEEALQSFESATKSAVERNDPALAGKSFFNLGVAQGEKGDFQAAAQSYLKALDYAQAQKNTQLEKDARKNLELLSQMKMQQKQKQEQKENQDGKDNKDNKDQQQGKSNSPEKDKDGKKDGSSASDDQNDPNKDQKKEQNKDGDKEGEEKKDPQQQKQYQDPSQGRQRGQFKSQKLSQEDADRVMAELSQREKKLQEKLKKQKGRPQGADKDW